MSAREPGDVEMAKTSGLATASDNRRGSRASAGSSISGQDDKKKQIVLIASGALFVVIAIVILVVMLTRGGGDAPEAKRPPPKGIFFYHLDPLLERKGQLLWTSTHESKVYPLEGGETLTPLKPRESALEWWTINWQTGMKDEIELSHIQIERTEKHVEKKTFKPSWDDKGKLSSNALKLSDTKETTLEFSLNTEAVFDRNGWLQLESPPAGVERFKCDDFTGNGEVTFIPQTMFGKDLGIFIPFTEKLTLMPVSVSLTPEVDTDDKPHKATFEFQVSVTKEGGLKLEAPEVKDTQILQSGSWTGLSSAQWKQEKHTLMGLPEMKSHGRSTIHGSATWDVAFTVTRNKETVTVKFQMEAVSCKGQGVFGFKVVPASPAQPALRKWTFEQTFHRRASAILARGPPQHNGFLPVVLQELDVKNLPAYDNKAKSQCPDLAFRLNMKSLDIDQNMVWQGSSVAQVEITSGGLLTGGKSLFLWNVCELISKGPDAAGNHKVVSVIWRNTGQGSVYKLVGVGKDGVKSLKDKDTNTLAQYNNDQWEDSDQNPFKIWTVKADGEPESLPDEQGLDEQVQKK